MNVEQPRNGIAVSDYVGSATDNELRALLGLIRTLPTFTDVRQAARAYMLSSSSSHAQCDDNATMSLSSNDQSTSVDDSLVECDTSTTIATSTTASAMYSCYDTETSAEDDILLDADADDISEAEDDDLTPCEWD